MKKIKRSKAALMMALAISFCLLIAGCGHANVSKAIPGEEESGTTAEETDTTIEQETEESNEPGKEPSDMTKPVIEIVMENGGTIEVELDQEAAPETVANFLALVDEGFYDGLTFHRIIENFMIQGGCPLGTGTGGSDKKVTGEFAANGFDNPISHKRGVISMARSQDMNSASCQFFITHGNSEFLDGEYAAFGVVTSGMDVVDEIATVPTGANDKPDSPVVIKTIRRK